MILGIDPKVDYAFKKLFGSEANKLLLLALLNAVLRAFIAAPIDDLDILNPFNDKDILDDKLSILDIKARDRNGHLYNIEMEMAAAKAYPKRILYYGRNFINHSFMKETTIACCSPRSRLVS